MPSGSQGSVTLTPVRTLTRASGAGLAVMATGFVLPNTLSATSGHLVDEGLVGPGLLGAAAALAFATAAITSAATGRWVYQHGGLRAATWCGSWSLVAVVLVVLAPHGSLVLASAVAGGVAFAIAIPLVMQTVGAASGAQGRHQGVAQAGSQLGGLLVAASVAVGAVVGSWRLGVVTAAVAIAMSSVALRSGFASPAPRRPRVTVPAPDGLRLLTFVLNGTVVTVLTLGPTYAVELGAVPPSGASSITGLLVAATLVAKLVWGRVTDGPGSAGALRSMSLLAAAAVAALAIATVGGVVWLWVGIGLFGLTAGAWLVPVLAGVAGAPNAAQLAAGLMVWAYIGAASVPLVAGLIWEMVGAAPVWAILAVGLCTVPRVAGALVTGSADANRS